MKYSNRKVSEMLDPYDGKVDGNVFHWIIAAAQILRAAKNPVAGKPRHDFRRLRNA